MNNRTIKSNSALTILLTFALFSIASAQTPAANQQSDITHRVDQLFARFDRPDSPGCALGVVKVVNLDNAVTIVPAPFVSIWQISLGRFETKSQNLLLSHRLPIEARRSEDPFLSGFFRR